MVTAEESPSSVKPRFRLAIIGGGIAGLTLAVALGHFEDACAPVQVDMYEAGAEITTVGAGITVWQRTWTIMRHLGIHEQLAKQGVKEADDGSAVREGEGEGEGIRWKTGFVFRKSDWMGEGYEFGRLMVPGGSTAMHRADMVDVLVRNLPASCAIHTSKRLIRYEESEIEPRQSDDNPSESSVGGPYTLYFADGTTAEADVIVGADGIKSKTRAAMYEYAHARECADATNVRKEECVRCSGATPKWTGTVAYRYLIPTERLHAVKPTHHALVIKSPMSYSGKGKHIITYPISHGKYLNWIGFVTVPGGEGTTYPHKWVIDAPREDVVAHFSGWETEVDQMLSCVQKPTLWAIHVLDNLPFSVYGRVALMGDAVHAMTTHFGAGGGQAIEDAYILGRLLSDSRTTLSRVADVLKIYQDVRLPFARDVVRDASKAGLMYEFNYPGLYDGAPESASLETESLLDATKEKLHELKEGIEKLWQWQWMEPVDEQWEAAERRYEGLIVEDSCRGSATFALHVSRR